MAKAQTYVALIADIVGSRRLPDRYGVQERLEAAMPALSRKLKPELAADFTVTLGDEFQALIRRPSDVVAILNETDHLLSGIPLRFGVGVGCLTTDFRETAIGMDGPCFHEARDAITTGKQEGRWVTVSGFGGDDALLNALFGLLGVIRLRWTQIQADTVAAARRAGSHRDVAAARNRHESTVSKALKSAAYDAVADGEAAVRNVMFRHDPDDPTGAAGGGNAD
ncbi:MAG: SatD family protein [Candidatus Eisenbacteria bacterium]